MSKARAIGEGARTVEKGAEEVSHSGALSKIKNGVDYAFNHKAEKAMEKGKKTHSLKRGVAKAGGAYLAGRAVMGGGQGIFNGDGLMNGVAKGAGEGVGKLFTMGLTFLSTALETIAKPLVKTLKEVTKNVNKENAQSVVTDEGTKSTKNMSKAEIEANKKSIADPTASDSDGWSPSTTDTEKQAYAQKVGSQANTMMNNQDQYKQQINDYQSQTDNSKQLNADKDKEVEM